MKLNFQYYHILRWTRIQHSLIHSFFFSLLLFARVGSALIIPPIYTVALCVSDYVVTLENNFASKAPLNATIAPIVR